MSTNERSSQGLPTVAVAIVASILPVFLLGSLSVEIRSDLGHGETTAGLVLSAFFGASALVSSRLGRWIDRSGPRTALTAALIGTTVVSIALAAGARAAWSLAVLAAVGGVCNATAQLGANVFIARDMPLHRQGIGFAIKQSAMPGASLVAGLTLPAVALTLGWRWAFVVGAGLAATALVLVRRNLTAASPPAALPSAGAAGETVTTDDGGTDDVATEVAASQVGGTEDRAPAGALPALAIAAAFSTAAAITLGGFFVESAIDAGIDASTAGLAFAGGSVVSILARLLVGGLADRRQGNLLGVVAAMIALGAAMSVLFTWRSPAVQFIGVPLAFGAGWAWPGLFNLSVVRAAPTFPGRATGITQTGTYVGGAVGPLVFGAVAESASYSTAWVVAAVLGLAASVAVLIGRSILNGTSRLRVRAEPIG
ncbi:MAG: MFS transporter [Microthrixaceae bacterium]